MFVGPWIELAGATRDKVLHPNWIQVRSSKTGGDSQGARSNRIICARPNLLNIPKKWRRSISAGFVHPAFLNVPELPFMRTYVLPSKGKIWGRRDYNQQEVRLFAHYEEGPVMEGFIKDPRFDIHEGVRIEEERALIEAGLRKMFERDDAKTTVFGAFYGQGLPGLMEALKLRDPEDKEVGRAIHKALHKAVPSISELSKQLQDIGKAGDPIRTWGGRLYYSEEPKYVAKFGRDMTFHYKLISYLIQGSGADVMKEALVRYDADPKRQEDLTVTVYDEVNIDLPNNQKGAKQEMTVLRDCMQSVEVDIPMLSDGETGLNWGTLKKFDV
jgi:DNA polymerase I-like protein with 3'-5' exonuclease and polymerase domains